MGAVQLILVRHGESEGNLAAAEADRVKADRVLVPARDAGVVLSAGGREQAEALGRHLGTWSPDELPESVWVSPYTRARQTAEIALSAAGLELEARWDERLRDRELGILDALTGRGVRRLHPDEADRRRWLGKLYSRPPDAESWADVALRLRSLLADLDREEDGRRILIVTHDAVITLFRYVCVRIEEQPLLDNSRGNPIRNCSITRLVRPSGVGRWTPDLVNEVGFLARSDAPVTEHPGRRRGR